MGKKKTEWNRRVSEKHFAVGRKFAHQDFFVGQRAALPDGGFMASGAAGQPVQGTKGQVCTYNAVPKKEAGTPIGLRPQRRLASVLRMDSRSSLGSNLAT